MIEFLPPRDDAFGAQDGAGLVRSDDDIWDDAQGDDPDDGSPRSRWATVVAAVTVTGLLTAGVIAAAPWRGDDPGAAPTTTVERPTVTTAGDGRAGDGRTGGAAATLDPDVTGWLLDPPVAGQRLVSVIDPGSDGSALDAFGPGWAEVWASPGATRTSGRWVSIALRLSAGADTAFDRLEAGWFPVDDGGRAGRATVAGDGVVQIAVVREAADGTHLLTVHGAGFTLPELLELTTATTVDDRRPGADDDRAVIGSTGLLDGLERIAEAPSGLDLVDAVLVGPSEGGGAFYVGPDPSDLTMLREHPTGAIDPRLAALTVGEGVSGDEPWASFDGFVPDTYTVGERDIQGIEVRVVRFVTGDSDVWLVTTLSSGALPAMLDDVRRVTAADWAAAHDRALAPSEPITLGRDDPELLIGGGPLADGTEWSATVSIGRGDLRMVAGDDRLGARPLTSLIGVDRGGALGTIALDDAMVVVAASSVEGAELRIRWADGSTLQAPLADLVAAAEAPSEPGRLDESFWSSWAGTRVSAVLAEPSSPGAPFTAEVVAPDGTTLARFDPWSLGSAA